MANLSILALVVDLKELHLNKISYINENINKQKIMSMTKIISKVYKPKIYKIAITNLIHFRQWKIKNQNLKNYQI